MKGQGSTEYLVIFAAVLVIALIVIFLLGQFTGFSQKSLLDQSKSALSSEVPVSIEDWAPIGDGTTNISLKLKNKGVKKVYIRDIMIDGASASAVTPTLPKKLSPSQDKEFNAQFSSLCASGDSGQLVEFDVQINYSYTSSGTQYMIDPAIPLRMICP